MQAIHASPVSTWFMCKSHHYDTSIIHLVQNVFDKDPSHRTISLNATYIVLFKNPRDMSQVSYVDKQVYPGGNGLLTAACRDAMTTRAHSYMVIDFNQATPEKFCLHNTLLPAEDFPDALAYGPASQPWMRRRTSAVGNIRTALTRLVASFAATHSPWQQGTVHQESATSAPSGGSGGSSSSSGGVVATAPHHHSGAYPHPPGVIPCNLCSKQLVVGADKDPINTLSESPTDRRWLPGPAGQHCGTASHEGPPLNCGQRRLPGEGP